MRLPPGLEIVRELGRGAEGVTYEAVLRGARVAAKRLDGGEPTRIRDEVRALSATRAPGLCMPRSVLDADDGAIWLVMPLVTGDDFVTHVRRDALPRAQGGPSLPMAFGQPLSPLGASAFAPCSDAGLARLRACLAQLADALEALHACGYVHRDLHARNVRVTETGRVVVLDLGTSARIGEPPSAERLVGPVSHVAPEAGDGAPLSEAADWYGVGVLLFESLTGDVPFFGSGRDVVIRKQTVAAPRASLLVPSVPDDLDALCAALLEARPSLRAGAPAVRALRRP